LGGVGEAGQLSLIGVAFEPLCNDNNNNNNNNNEDDRNILVQAETDLV